MSALSGLREALDGLRHGGRVAGDSQVGDRFDALVGEFGAEAGRGVGAGGGEEVDDEPVRVGAA